MISTRSTGFDIGVCLGLHLGPLGYARCPVELGAGPKRHGPEEIIGKLREAEIVLAQGGTTADACRRLSISEQTYYRWRKEYGGLKTDQARRMKDLEKENARLRRAISDLTLDKLILQEAARGNY